LRLVNIPLVIRYIAVGITASLIYQLGFVLTRHFPLEYGNLIAVSMSAIISYLGHHSITFLRKGNHRKYLLRFTIQLTFTYLLSTLTHRWFLNHHYHYFFGIIAVWFIIPILNFMILQLWTFSQTAMGNRNPENKKGNSYL